MAERKIAVEKEEPITKSDWLQFLENKVAMKSSQSLGITSIFIVGILGIISIYTVYNDFVVTFIAEVVLIVLYTFIIRRALGDIYKEAKKAEDLLDKIMNEEITIVKEIRDNWYSKK